MCLLNIPELSKCNHSWKGLLIALGLLVYSGTGFAQSLKVLEKKREVIEADIRLTNKLLESTTQNKEEALQRYVTLQNQIKRRKDLIATLTKEIAALDKRTIRSQQVVESLEEDITALKAEYATIIQSVFRQKMTQSSLLFLLAADDFNDIYKRWQYIRQYDAYRKKQSNLIVETQNMLQSKLEQIKIERLKKADLIGQQQTQTQTLSSDMKSRNDLYRVLKRDEKHLKKELEKQLAAQAKLDKALEKIIFAATSTTSSTATTALPKKESKTSISKPSKVSETELLKWTSDFRTQKGQLPWPVESGIISRYFGEQAHPSIPRIKINNNGIDITTEPNQDAKAIFTGVVAGTQFIPGYQHTVIVKHGEYFTVYSNLQDLLIQKGDRIEQGQSLGRISTNRKNNNTEIHFEVWRKKKRLNPKDWIK